MDEATATAGKTEDLVDENVVDNTTAPAPPELDLQSAATMEIISRATAFLVKLWRILAEPSYGHAIQWSAGPTTFTIHDTKAMEREVLPTYFRSSHYASFQRQLNYFSFSKVGKCSYTHPDFDRSKPSRVLLIKRKTNTGNLTKKRKAQTEKISHGLGEDHLASGRSIQDLAVPQSNYMQHLTKKPHTDKEAAGADKEPLHIERPCIVSPTSMAGGIAAVSSIDCSLKPRTIMSKLAKPQTPMTPFYDCLKLCDKLATDITIEEVQALELLFQP